MNFKSPKRARIFSRAFTLIELLVVIAIIGILAGLIVGLAGRASESKITKRAEVERDAFVMAIQVYKEKLGYYPQDNRNDPSKSPLYNELTKKRIPDSAKTDFGIEDIANVGANSDNFLKEIKTSQYKILKSGPRADAPGEVFEAGQLTFAYKNVPWHYNSSSPTNNPDSFDLWVEVDIGGKKRIIGNWNQ